MKIFFAITFFLLPTLAYCAGGKKSDSLRRRYALVKTDTARADILAELADLYAQDKPDSELFIAQQALAFSQKIKYIHGEMYDLKLMAEGYEFLGNYPLALQYYLQRLKLDETNPVPARQVATMLSIGNLYQLEGDYNLALVYAKKGYQLVVKNKLEIYRWYSYMGFAEIYIKMNDLPNAIAYNKRAYDLALKNKNAAWIGMCLNNTGNAFAKAKQPKTALEYYRRAIPYLKLNNIENFLCESYQGIGSLLYQEGNPDSAISYTKISLNLAINRHFREKYIKSCQLLTDMYEGQHLADSALVYQGKMIVMKDSVYNQEKERAIANLTISEQLRQKERLQEKIDEGNERRYKLKLLLVGLLIPFSFLVSLILSKRKMHPRVVEFSGIISLLLLFEYLTILLHPMVVAWTNHSPFLEILIFVCIAAVLTPSHHRLENWMLHKLTAHRHHHLFDPSAIQISENIVAATESTGEDSPTPETAKSPE